MYTIIPLAKRKAPKYLIISGILLGSLLFFNNGGGAFSQQAFSPIAQTMDAISITQTSAILNGQINPNGYTTTYYYEYGQSSSLGARTPVQTIGASASNVAVPFSVTGLISNTPYQFRLVAQNQFGISIGAIKDFTTVSMPVNYPNDGASITTNAATDVYGVSAILHAYVQLNNSRGLAWFAYGTDANNLSITTTPVAIYSVEYYRTSNLSPFITAQIQNLAAGTTYYFRAVIQNNGVTMYGNTLIFTTSGGLPTFASYYNSTNGSYYYASPASTYAYTAPATYVAPANSYSYGNPSYDYSLSYPYASAYPYPVSYEASSYVSPTYSTNYPAYSYPSQYAYPSYGSNYAYSSYGYGYADQNYSYANAYPYGSNTSYASTYGGYAQGGTTITQGVQLFGPTSATLSGSAVSIGNASTGGWFEYGLTGNLGLQTAPQGIGYSSAPIPFSATIYGLAPNSLYYYRAVSQNQYGAAYGATLTFQTGADPFVVAYAAPQAPIQKTQAPVVEKQVPAEQTQPAATQQPQLTQNQPANQSYESANISAVAQSAPRNISASSVTIGIILFAVAIGLFVWFLLARGTA